MATFAAQNFDGMKWLKSLLKVLFVIYVLICGVLYFVQDKIVFRPHPLPENYSFRHGEEVELEVDEDVYLNCLWLKESNSKGVILYLHGNRGSNRRCLHQAENMSGNNYDIFMPDYRGYGKSDGEIVSEKQLFEDVQKVYDFLKKHYREGQIVIAGYSLGTGMASYLAANNKPQQVFLVAPYLSFTDLKDRRAPVIPDFLIKYPLRNELFLTEVKCPVTLFHGTRDEVIPFDSSEQLAQLQPDLISLIEIRNTGHRRAIFSSEFRNGVRRLLR